jgi:hypothetical protein
MRSGTAGDMQSLPAVISEGGGIDAGAEASAAAAAAMLLAALPALAMSTSSTAAVAKEC